MLTKKYQAVRERSRILEDVLMQNKYAVYEEALAEMEMTNDTIQSKRTFGSRFRRGGDEQW